MSPVFLFLDGIAALLAGAMSWVGLFWMFLLNIIPSFV